MVDVDADILVVIEAVAVDDHVVAVGVVAALDLIKMVL